MGVLDHEAGRLTRSRKIDKNSSSPEDVFVFRVFGDPPTPPVTKPKSKLIKRPASQIKALLDTSDEEDTDHD